MTRLWTTLLAAAALGVSIAVGAYAATRTPVDTAHIRGVSGILLGAGATVFALVAGNTVILFQLVASNSPTGLRYYPTHRVVWILTGLLALLVGDGLLCLSPNLTSPFAATLAYSLLVLHLFGAFTVIWLVGSTRRWLDPKTAIQAVATEICSLPSTESEHKEAARRKLLDAVNELSATFTDKRYTSTIRPIIEAYHNLILRHPKELAQSEYWLSQGVNRLIWSISQLGVNLASEDLDTYVPDVADLFMDLFTLRHCCLTLPAESSDHTPPALIFQAGVKRVLSRSIREGQMVGATRFVTRMGMRLFESKESSIPTADTLGVLLVCIETGLEEDSRLVVEEAVARLTRYPLDGLQADDPSLVREVRSLAKVSGPGHSCAEQLNAVGRLRRILAAAKYSSTGECADSQTL